MKSSYNRAPEQRLPKTATINDFASIESFHWMKTWGRRLANLSLAEGRLARLFVIGIVSMVVSAASAQGGPADRSLAHRHLVSAQGALAAGDTTAAREKLHLALQADPKFAEAYLLLGTIEFRSGNNEKSIQLYKKAVSLHPTSYPGHYNLALAYLREKRLQDGKAELETAVKLDPKQPDAAYDLGVVLLQMDKPSDALAHLMRARALDPKRPDASFNIIRANLEAGKAAEARSEAQAAGTQFENDFQWNAALGQLFFRNGQPADATVFLQKAEQIRPDPATHRALALAYLASGDAKRVFDMIPEPKTGEDHYLLGSAHYALHQFPQADGESELALSLVPDDPEALVLRVRLLQRVGKQDEALGLAEKAAALVPSWDEPHYLAGVSLFYIRRYPEASQRLARAAELNPKSARTVFLHGVSLASEGKMLQAEQALVRAVALQPQNARFQTHLGILLMRKNDYAGAERAFRKAIALSPEYGLSHYELGKILARSNQLQAAAGELNEAVNRDPSLGSAYYQLSRVYAKLGDAENSSRVMAEFQKFYREQTSEAAELAADAQREAVPDSP